MDHSTLIFMLTFAATALFVPPPARVRGCTVALCARRHFRCRVGRRPPHQIRRGAAQNPGGPTLHRAILLRNFITSLSAAR